MFGGLGLAVTVLILAGMLGGTGRGFSGMIIDFFSIFVALYVGSFLAAF